MKLKVREGNYYEVGDDRRLKMQLCRLELFSGFWILDHRRQSSLQHVTPPSLLPRSLEKNHWVLLTLNLCNCRKDLRQICLLLGNTTIHFVRQTIGKKKATTSHQKSAVGTKSQSVLSKVQWWSLLCGLGLKVFLQMFQDCHSRTKLFVHIVGRIYLLLENCSRQHQNSASKRRLRIDLSSNELARVRRAQKNLNPDGSLYLEIPCAVRFKEQLRACEMVLQAGPIPIIY